MNLANFMITQLYAAFAPLKIGMDILVQEEGVMTDVMVAQGGLFKTPVIGQQVLADMLNIPITIMETADEGGPWGMAILALFAKYGNLYDSLANFLDEKVFRQPKVTTLVPNLEGSDGCIKFMENYRKVLPAEEMAGKVFSDTN